MFIIEWGHRTKFQTLAVDRVGGLVAEPMSWPGFVKNNATTWLHHARYDLQDSQLGCKSKMEPSVATVSYQKEIIEKVWTSLTGGEINWKKWSKLLPPSYGEMGGGCHGRFGYVHTFVRGALKKKCPKKWKKSPIFLNPPPLP